ncbi:MAG: tetratricopeptide repeat protein [Nannocystis sp.]|nr:tetratricopeptide repeat protein [Nannocystis sp.]
MNDHSKAPRHPPPTRALRHARALCFFVLALTAGCASYIDKARTARDERDYEKAESLYRTAIAKDREALDRELAREELVAMMILRAKARAKENPPAALDIYTAAIELSPDDEEAKDGIGRLLASLGRVDEAIAVLGGEKYGKCDLCERYLAVLLAARAKGHEDRKDYDAALADYGRALQLIPDPTTAFSVARIYRIRGEDEAAAAVIEEAVPRIRQDDEQAQAAFVKVREEAVMKAAAVGDFALIDRYMSMFPPGSGGDAWYFLHLKVARERRRQMDLDGAIRQVAPLLGEDHRPSISESRRAEIERFLISLYTLKGANLLRAGQPAEADVALVKAGELDREDDGIKLLRALALAGQGDLDRAIQVAKALPEATRGHGEVVAILESMVVFERLAANDFDGAKAALGRGQAAFADQPEIHVAAAAILAVTPVLGLSKKEAALLRKSGLARYAQGIFRYGEALSEIAWASEQAKNLGENYLFRGPGAVERAESLARSISERYPFAVEFNGQPTTELTLRVSEGRSFEAKVSGPGGLDETVVISASAPEALVVREPGLVTITYERQKVVFLAESYTAVTVRLP